jgi:hypothetical protein
MLSGPSAAGLTGLEAARLDEIAEKAAKAGTTPAGQLLDQLSHCVDRGLTQQGMPPGSKAPPTTTNAIGPPAAPRF